MLSLTSLHLWAIFQEYHPSLDQKLWLQISYWWPHLIQGALHCFCRVPDLQGPTPLLSAFWHTGGWHQVNLTIILESYLLKWKLSQDCTLQTDSWDVPPLGKTDQSWGSRQECFRQAHWLYAIGEFAKCWPFKPNWCFSHQSMKMGLWHLLQALNSQK